MRFKLLLAVVLVCAGLMGLGQIGAWGGEEAFRGDEDHRSLLVAQMRAERAGLRAEPGGGLRVYGPLWLKAVPPTATPTAIPTVMASATTAPPTATPTATTPPPTATPTSLGIHGHVQVDGVGVAGVPLTLMLYDGGNWWDVATTTTDPTGLYVFRTAPTLASGHSFAVVFANEAEIGGRAWAYVTHEVTTYQQGEHRYMGVMEIGDVGLRWPYSGAEAGLPFEFQWWVRPQAPTDSYALTLFLPDDYGYLAQTYPLGYVDHVVINGLPEGYYLNTPYGWEVWAYDPNGGFAVSFEARIVTFRNYSPAPTPTTGSGSCDPAYPTVCIPSPPPDLDCADIPYRNFTVLPPDPHNFDWDHDGVGCET